jgi:N-methylhydantoinase A/oxoprolinase/acetone carboxylase beta subunit
MADAIGRALGARQRYAFELSPVFSAFGLSGLPVAHAYDVLAEGDGGGMLDELVARARRDMRSEGVATTDLALSLEVELGEAAVERIPLAGVDAASLATAEAALASRRDRLARLRASAPEERPVPHGGPPAGAEAEAPDRPTPARPAPDSTRAVAWRASPESTPVYDWTRLAPGLTITGPALIESSETTVAVPPGSVAHVGARGEVRFDGG